MNHVKECKTCQTYGTRLCGVHVSSKEQIEPVSLLVGIRKNIALINTCDCHAFGHIKINKNGAMPRPISSLYFPCLSCGGAIRFGDIEIYQKGFKAAGGDPDKVAVIDWIE